MDAEMSLPRTPLHHSPCAKPSVPHRSPFPVFQPLSSPPSSPSSSSPVACFSFPSLAACPRGGGSSLQPNEVSLGLFYLPQITFFFPQPRAAPHSRITGLPWYLGPGAAPSPPVPWVLFLCRPLGPPGQVWGCRCPGGAKLLYGDRMM